MNWGSLDNFLAMGGYGFYVWGSYGVTLALIAAEIALMSIGTASKPSTVFDGGAKWELVDIVRSALRKDGLPRQKSPRQSGSCELWPRLSRSRSRYPSGYRAKPS